MVSFLKLTFFIDLTNPECYSLSSINFCKKNNERNAEKCYGWRLIASSIINAEYLESYAYFNSNSNTRVKYVIFNSTTSDKAFREEIDDSRNMSKVISCYKVR